MSRLRYVALPRFAVPGMCHGVLSSSPPISCHACDATDSHRQQRSRAGYRFELLEPLRRHPLWLVLVFTAQHRVDLQRVSPTSHFEQFRK